MVMVLPVLKLLLLRVNDGIGLGVYNTMFEMLAVLVEPLAPLATLPLNVPLVLKAVNDTVNVPPSAFENVWMALAVVALAVPSPNCHK